MTVRCVTGEWGSTFLMIGEWASLPLQKYLAYIVHMNNMSSL